MALLLDNYNANATLQALQQLIAHRESQGFVLISFAKGQVGGLPANIASYRANPNPPGPITLVVVNGNQTGPVQESALNTGETGGNTVKTLVSYAIAFVQGNETNVAAYRG